MAKKSYKQRNAESILNTGKSLYQRRIESAQSRGLSKSQARGHAKKSETPASKLSTSKGTRGTRGTRGTAAAKKPRLPKIDKQVKVLKTGTKVIQTRSALKVFKELQSKMKGIGAGHLNRVYFQVYDPVSQKWVSVYQGKGKNGFHGITVEELMRRVENKMQTGDYDSFEDALWDVIEEDADHYNESEGYGGGTVPPSFSQVTMYVRPS
jgi:hypothetical protein